MCIRDSVGCVWGYESCFVVKARAKATKADLVIVNHNLLISDMVLKVDGFSELLPDVETVIIDEAHKLKSVSEKSFANQLTSSQIVTFLKELDQQFDEDSSTKLKAEIKRCRKALNAMTQFLSTRVGYMTFQSLLADKNCSDHYKTLQDAFTLLAAELKPLRSRTETLQNFWQRAESTIGFLESVTQQLSLIHI